VSANFWFMLWYTATMLVFGVLLYLFKVKPERLAREAKIARDARWEALKAERQGKPGICTRCGVRPVEEGGSMCTWCGI
jgi:hypothetical protein